MKKRSTISRDGRITVPVEIRDRLGLQPGVEIDFVVDDGGWLMLVPKTVSVRQLKGILPARNTSASLEEMEEAIADQAVLRGRTR